MFRKLVLNHFLIVFEIYYLNERIDMMRLFYVLKGLRSIDMNAGFFCSKYLFFKPKGHLGNIYFQNYKKIYIGKYNQ